MYGSDCTGSNCEWCAASKLNTCVSCFNFENREVKNGACVCKTGFVEIEGVTICEEIIKYEKIEDDEYISIVPHTVRTFGNHPDFGQRYDSDYNGKDIVLSTLDSNRKPQFNRKTTS